MIRASKTTISGSTITTVPAVSLSMAGTNPGSPRSAADRRADDDRYGQLCRHRADFGVNHASDRRVDDHAGDYGHSGQSPEFSRRVTAPLGDAVLR